MPYRIFINNQIYNIYCKKDRCEIQSGLEDQVQFLGFDPSARMCAVKIVNPSAHTQYLFNQGRLGVDLCHSNTGKGSRRHLADQGRRIFKQVQYKYHPRGSRCMVTQTVDNLNYIELPLYRQRVDGEIINTFQPNELKVSSGQRGYTSIKALLVSRNFSESTFLERGYATYSEKIRIKAVERNGEDFEIKHARYQPYPEQGLNVEYTPTESFRTGKLKLTISSDLIEEAFTQGKLYVIIAGDDVGSMIPANNCSRSNWGVISYGNPRGKKARDNPKYGHKAFYSSSHVMLIQDLEVFYTFNSGSTHRISRLLHLGKNHNDTTSELKKNLYLKFFIGKIDGKGQVQNIHTVKTVALPISIVFNGERGTYYTQN